MANKIIKPLPTDTTRKRLSRTKIEYARNTNGSLGYNWNFYPGCLHKPQGVCPVAACWAEAMSKRQKFDFRKPHLRPELLLAPLSIKKPSKILVNFMGDLGGEWVDPKKVIEGWTAQGFGSLGTATLKEAVFKVIRARPEHTFIFLTKNPSAWQKWNPWPDNAWVGATAWDAESFYDAAEALSKVKARHKWLSLEPLLGDINGGECVERGKRLDLLKAAGVSWVVVGAQTRPDVMPEISWVKEITRACDKMGVRVWLKDNLIPMFEKHDYYSTPEWALDSKRYYRQERPSG